MSRAKIIEMSPEDLAEHVAAAQMSAHRCGLDEARASTPLNAHRFNSPDLQSYYENGYDRARGVK